MAGLEPTSFLIIFVLDVPPLELACSHFRYVYLKLITLFATKASVDRIGVEPMTSCVQSRRSSQTELTAHIPIFYSVHLEQNRVHTIWYIGTIQTVLYTLEN